MQARSWSPPSPGLVAIQSCLEDLGAPPDGGRWKCPALSKIDASTTSWPELVPHQGGPGPSLACLPASSCPPKFGSFPGQTPLGLEPKAKRKSQGLGTYLSSHKGCFLEPLNCPRFPWPA